MCLKEWGKTRSNTPDGGDCSETPSAAAASYCFLKPDHGQDHLARDAAEVSDAELDVGLEASLTQRSWCCCMPRRRATGPWFRLWEFPHTILLHSLAPNLDWKLKSNCGVEILTCEKELKQTASLPTTLDVGTVTWHENFST